MCTAYEIGKRGGSHPDRALAEAIEEIRREQTRIVRPTLQAPILLHNGTLKTMSWGFRRPVPGGKTKQLWRTIVNSREDKLDGRMWSKAFRERRCLIPAAAFYEWIDNPNGKGKLPLRFESTADSLLWIAGIWEESEKEGLCYSMITTEPSDAIVEFHDRMPAVLRSDQWDSYLDGTLSEFGASTETLVFREAENFLKGKKPAKSPPQQELF